VPDERQGIWNEEVGAEQKELSNILGGGDNEENCGKLYQGGLCYRRVFEMCIFEIQNPELYNYTGLLCYYVVSYFPETVHM